MKRNLGSQIKWALYTGAFLLVFFFESCVFNRFPIRHAVPELAPLAVIAVGCFEGSMSGAVYGLIVGLFCNAVYYRSGAIMIPTCTVMGIVSGFTNGKTIGQTPLGMAVCSVFGMALLECGRVFYYHFFGGNPTDTLWAIAIPEGLYSLAFALPVYVLYWLIYRYYRTDSEL